MPKRRSNWNYRGRGYYFVTLTTQNKVHWFGRIENAKPVLSEIGKIAEKNWLAIPEHFPEIVLEDYVIMPNHIHGIVGIQKTSTKIREIPEDGRDKKMSAIAPQKGSLSVAIRSYKSSVTREARLQEPDFVWSRGFHDHPIYPVEAMTGVVRYIRNNPLKWEEKRKKR